RHAFSAGAAPPRLLTGAAYGGLKPLPAERLRRTYLHLLRSIALSSTILYIARPPAFVSHDLLT
ncbi:MAG: hypothetical protein ACREKR_14910, partial [Candidatus Methylomirabilales bacterium]